MCFCTVFSLLSGCPSLGPWVCWFRLLGTHEAHVCRAAMNMRIIFAPCLSLYLSRSLCCRLQAISMPKTATKIISSIGRSRIIIIIIIIQAAASRRCTRLAIHSPENIIYLLNRFSAGTLALRRQCVVTSFMFIACAVYAYFVRQYVYPAAISH